jgi:LysR family transcriptional regulator for bpeEF and oprC
MGTLDGIVLFAATVECGSFAAAARRLHVTASAVSRRVAGLEQELGVQLLARTTRTLRLTNDGQAFYARCVRILDELREAKEDLARVQKKPSGVLRVDAAVALTRKLLAPNMPRFLARYPEISVDLTARDQLLEPVAEGLDVMLRIGRLGDVNLMARRLGESELVFCGAPAYLKRRGTPTQPDDIKHHDVIGYLRDGRSNPWQFLGPAGVMSLDVKGPLRTNEIDAMHAAALAGRGLIMAFDFVVADYLQTGSLVRVLQHHPSTTWPIHALYPKNRHLLPKLRVFLDFVRGLFPPRRLQRGSAVPEAARPGTPKRH